ncbi:GTPase-binding protein rid1 [Exophiala dermatitidis]
MASNVLRTAQIFEDPEPQQRGRRTYRSHAPSATDVVKSRRKENQSPTKTLPRDYQDKISSASPLGERHINSPPQTKRVATKFGEEQRSPAKPGHKKTGSSVSLRGLILGKEKAIDESSVSSTEGCVVDKKPKKVKSAANLTGLLKRKSKKDLREDTNNENGSSPSKQTPVEVPTPIWQQFATQPLESPDGTMLYPMSQRKRIEEEIKLYTPKDYSEFRPKEQRNFYGYGPALPTSIDHKPPQRPFLEHKSSRSSVFTENLDDEPRSSSNCGLSKDRNSSRPGSARTPDARPALATRSTESSQTDTKTKRGSRVFDAIQSLNMKSRKDHSTNPDSPSASTPSLSPQEIDSAFEQVLDSLNIPLNMRDNMRNLKPDVKAGLIKGERVGSGSSMNSAGGDSSEPKSTKSPQKQEPEGPKNQDDDGKEGKRSRSRSRPRSRILTLSRRDEESSSNKSDRPGSSSRSRSKSRNKSVDVTNARPGSSRAMASSSSLVSLNPADSATTPGDFIHYLREVQKPELVEVGKIHKLRILVRNESISWTDHFVTKGGMDELLQLYYRIKKIEWREEHEDSLLHETLLCLKGLCTTSRALQRLHEVEQEFFPALLSMLFDPDRKGPAEFSTRGVIISLLFAHLSAAMDFDVEGKQKRAAAILGFLKDPAPEQDKQPLDFVSQMHVPRPYRVWCKEVSNVTKEVFWIFLHHLNVIPIVNPGSSTAASDGSDAYARAHFPAPRPPHPAAPYVGGVEWEATQYLATHLDLVNGLIAFLPTANDRNSLREELRISGFEKVMGGTLRTCKEKFYGGVHEGLKCWVAAAKADGWYIEDVRAGPPRDVTNSALSSPRKSPVKKKANDEPPKLDLVVDVGLKVEEGDKKTANAPATQGGAVEDHWI